MVSEEEIKAVAFNMNLQFLQHLAELLRRADYYLEINSLLKCNNTMLSIKLNIIHSLTDEERKEFEVLEKATETSLHFEKKRLEYSDIGFPSDATEKFHKKYSKVPNPLKKNLVAYRTRLQDVMDKKGYLVKKADDLKRAF